MQDFEYFFEKKGGPFKYLPSFSRNFCQNSLHDQPFWTTFEI